MTDEKTKQYALLVADQGAVRGSELWIDTFLDSYLEAQQSDEAVHADMLAEALKGLLADIVEYQTINYLGGENNHWQVAARKVLAIHEQRRKL